MEEEYKELLLALERVGQSKDAAVWLITFAQEDIQAASKGRLEDLLEEIRAFCLYGSLGLENIKDIHEEVFFLFPPSLYLQDLPKNPKDFPERIAEFQSIISPFLKAIEEENNSENLPTFKVSLDLSWGKTAQKNWVLKVVGRNQNREGSLKDAFTYHALVLLRNFASFIRKCSDCPRLFLANRSKQQFCSTRCLVRVTQQKLRKKRKSKKLRKAQSKERTDGSQNK